MFPRIVIQSFHARNFLRRSSIYFSKARRPSACGQTNTTESGGHIEKGENAYLGKRELLEETGLSAELWLCGTVIVDAGETGICLFLFTGECLEGEPQPSPEGLAEWIPYQSVPELPVVEDLPVLLAKIHHMQRGDQPFFAWSHYDEGEKLIVEFGE